MANRRPSFRGKAVTVVCTDLARSRRFYEDVLGAVRLPEDEGYGCPWYRLGDVVVTLMPNAAEGSSTTLTQATAMLMLEVDDLAAAHRWLVEQGVTIVDAPADGPFVLIADPDGVLIEVWQFDE